MIERLELHRWRAFDNVAIEFLPGTTFLVAPNGVGKTSLLLGLTWALFGDRANVDAKSCVRIGHSTAEALVTVALSDDRRLTVHRSVSASGKETADYRLGDQRVEPTAGQGMLADEFGAALDVAARLAVIRGSGKDDGELQLREHLYDAFGVSGLRRAAAVAARLHKQAEAARKKLRSASRAQLTNREALAERADELRTNLEQLNAERVPLADAVAAAREEQEAVGTWAAYDEALATRAAEIEAFLAAAHNGIIASTLAEFAETLTAALGANRVATERAQATLTEAQAQAFAARSALALLEGRDPACPTCARPFIGGELERAISAQDESLTLAEGRIAAAESDSTRLRDDKDQLEQLAARAEQLVRPIPAPSSRRPLGDPEAAVEAAQQALQQHDELTGSVAAERKSIVAQLDDDDELRAAYEAERVAFRQEALTRAAAAALTGTAERLANEYIEPLSEQVRWRWKALFGEDGLQLRPDGTIVRVAGSRELSWSQLSSGEQLWARLVASLLVLRSSTTLPFAWLDEPLEHLDPRARRIVATDLASATTSGRPVQMIVTTYEHTLARQLAEDLPNTYVHRINRTETVHPPPGSRRRPPAGSGQASSGRTRPRRATRPSPGARPGKSA